MEATIAVMAHTKIQIWHMKDGILQRDKLFDSLRPLLPSFETYKFAISQQPDKFRVVIITYGDDEEMSKLALKSLKFSSGKCLHEGEMRNYSLHKHCMIT